MAVGTRRYYPDFTIEQFWGADSDENPKADVVRVIVEVASVLEGPIKGSATYSKVELQLEHYMLTLGPSRWEGQLLGIGILGNQVYMLKMRSDNTVGPVEDPMEDPRYLPRPVIDGDEWISMFDYRFVEELDFMHGYCMSHDND